MARQRDPIEARDDGSEDLYEISHWEMRTRFDRFAAWLYGAMVKTVRWTVIGLAVAILIAQFAIGGLGLLADRVVGTFVVLSIVPAAILAAYLWRADVTASEPLDAMVVTFLLGILFASFAGVLNSVAGLYIPSFEDGIGLVQLLGTIVFFYLVVGPVEESVKLLAVRLHAYRSASFNAVIDGAVYGAVAGLGFATIENALYITQSIESMTGMTNLLGAGSGIATIRALAGPGHVIYSAWAGYYLGLARFNREQAGPIVVKGLTIAALIHATYNTAATTLVPIAAGLLRIDMLIAFFGFVVLYDGLFVYLLIRKLAAYNSAYRRVHNDDERGETIQAEPTEFE